jgi:hypothetical protein
VIDFIWAEEFTVGTERTYEIIASVDCLCCRFSSVVRHWKGGFER